MPAAKPITDQIALIKAKKEKLAARLNALEAKAKQADRKRETHRRIVVGTAVLAHIEQDAEFAEMVRLVLSVNVTLPADRAVITDLVSDVAATGTARDTKTPKAPTIPHSPKSAPVRQ